MIDLDGRRMRVTSTAPNGVVGGDTVFEFAQRGARVVARYAGGRVRRGALAGRLRGDELTFRFVQLQDESTWARGRSRCAATVGAGGAVELVERFTWSDGSGGVNVFRELPA